MKAGQKRSMFCRESANGSFIPFLCPGMLPLAMSRVRGDHILSHDEVQNTGIRECRDRLDDDDDDEKTSRVMIFFHNQETPRCGKMWTLPALPDYQVIEGAQMVLDNERSFTPPTTKTSRTWCLLKSVPFSYI